MADDVAKSLYRLLTAHGHHIHRGHAVGKKL